MKVTEIGTKVKLTIRRFNEKPFDVTIKREEIKIQSVKTSIKGEDVLYIRITSFSEDVMRASFRYREGGNAPFVELNIAMTGILPIETVSLAIKVVSS